MILEPFDNNYFKALIILLPGFLTLQVFRYFVGSNELSELEMVMLALSFSLVNFLVTALLYSFAFAMVLYIGKKTSRSWKISMPFVSMLVLLSVASGWLYAQIEERAIPYRLAGTTRSSGERTWITVFRQNTISWNSFVRVTLGNGMVYGGWPESASETESNELFIRPAYVIGPTKKATKLDGEGILVFGKDLVSVEFVDKHPSKW